MVNFMGRDCMGKLLNSLNKKRKGPPFANPSSPGPWHVGNPPPHQTSDNAELHFSESAPTDV